MYLCLLYKTSREWKRNMYNIIYKYVYPAAAARDSATSPRSFGRANYTRITRRFIIIKITTATSGRWKKLKLNYGFSPGEKNKNKKKKTANRHYTVLYEVIFHRALMTQYISRVNLYNV